MLSILLERSHIDIEFNRTAIAINKSPILNSTPSPQTVCITLCAYIS